MGHSSSPPAPPPFQPSTIMYGNQVVGQTYKDANGNVVNAYYPTPAQQQNQQMAQDKINQILPTLDESNPALAKQWAAQANSYADQATAQFNREYDPTMRNLREDAASRFGTLQQTPYFDRMQQLETQVKMPAYEDIARQATLLQQDLANQDQGRKLQELQALGYNLSQDQQNFLNNLQAPLSTANSANAVSQNNYLAGLQSWQAQNQMGQNATNAALGALGGAAAAIL